MVIEEDVRRSALRHTCFIILWDALAAFTLGGLHINNDKFLHNGGGGWGRLH